MQFLRRLWAILRLRCPRCWQGRVFRGVFAMNDPCPVCGLVFQREEGYFLGSMYVSYFLGSFVLGALFVLGHVLLPEWNLQVVLLLALVPYCALIPPIFWYSRVIWMYIDRWVCPGDASAGSYEKMRQSEKSKEPRTK